MENTNAHTPGPWMASLNRPKPSVLSSRSGKIGLLASCEFTLSKHGNASCPTLEQAKANARLIAAAPELLEALVSMVLSFKSYPPSPAEKFARAAIAKATGQS